MTLPPFPDGVPARAVVDLDAISDNVRALREHAPSSDLMAVVKADGYGHGMLPAARAALAGGATWLGVATAAEALALRAGLGQHVPVLVWLLTPGAPFADLVAADVDVTVAAPWAVDEVAAGARAAGRVARVHLKVDTGLSRNGVATGDLGAVVERLAALEASGEVRVVGVFSHLACADEPDHPSIARQATAFDAALGVVEAAGLRPEVRHLANSAATLTLPDLHHDLVRPGISVYGNSPGPLLGPPGRYGLRPAMTFQARLASVKQVAAGEGVSYGHLYTTTQDTTVGLVPVGYGDGVPRHGSGGSAGPGGPIAVGPPAARRVLRVAGRVCMDQLVLDLGPGATDSPGDVVTLFGASDGVPHGADVPNAQDWADAAGTISYEIVTRLAGRVVRQYVPTEGEGAS
ncbi:alanine racemase [Isoptericola chiayiensis]|uniref:Alanine racemase n=1 Tax=Isoptericola chiayiensis TaxID=579446 RepID=A0ABP8YS36_9MICO|nr:alanine racemase [Isoptericola chiayiensis]